jgi:hypothetical protein
VKALGTLLIGRTFSACSHKKILVIELGRISAVLSDELEKKLRFKALEKFGGRNGDLSRAMEEAVKTWVATEK